jgi:hypothetical protein
MHSVEVRLRDDMHGIEMRISDRVSSMEGKLDSMRIFMLVIGGMMATILAAALQVTIKTIF